MVERDTSDTKNKVKLYCNAVIIKDKTKRDELFDSFINYNEKESVNNISE